MDNVTCGLYYKYRYNGKLMNLKIISAVACTIDMITIIFDYSMIINDASRVINYTPRVTRQFGPSL